MLIDFKVSNYLSFDEMQTLSLKAGKVRNFSERLYCNQTTKLLKFMAIYGANASGKSNLVEALSFAQSIIIEGLKPSYSTQYCRLSEENKVKPSHFEFTLELAGRRFTYGFEVILSTSSFVSEWLFENTYGDNYKTIFKRTIPQKVFIVDEYFKDSAINERLKIYAEDITADSSILFLSLMNKNKDSLYESFEPLRIYKLIYYWFRYKFSVNSPDNPITSFSSLSDENSISEISKVLSEFGTGVSQFNLIEVTQEKLVNSITKDLIEDISNHLAEQKKICDENKWSHKPTIMLRNPLENVIFIVDLDEQNQLHVRTLQFSHNNTTAVFALNEESDGTARLLDLIEVLLTSENDKVYVIDEINRRFHPLLTYAFVQKYLSLAQKRNIQLIVTTHESKIMDFDLLRKDEINFVNKDDLGKSEVYSLERFGERFDKKISLAYLKGEYGAIPVFEQK